MQEFSLVYNNLFVFLESVDEPRPTYACGQFMQGSSIMSTPLGGGHIIFALSGIRRPSRLVSGHFKEKYLSYLYQILYGCLLVL